MDWADDIAYSVHDVDDWFHAGFMPIASLVASEEQLSDLSARIVDRWLERGKITEGDRDVVDGAIRNLFQSREGPFGQFVVAKGAGHPITDPTSWEAREAIRFARSVLFDEFQGATRLAVRVDDQNLSRRYALKIEIDSKSKRRCDILRELLWIYVVGSSRMATHQAGQRHVVTELLTHFSAAAQSDAADALDVFPLDVRQDLMAADNDLKRLRLVVDFVSGMTDAYALRLHARITGGETRFLEYI
jgi:dGTPase